MRVGSVVTMRLRQRPLPVATTWRVRIDALERPTLIVDVAERSPVRLLAARARVRAPSTDDRTLMTDRVTYRLPLGPLGEFGQSTRRAAPIGAHLRRASPADPPPCSRSAPGRRGRRADIPRGRRWSGSAATCVWPTIPAWRAPRATVRCGMPVRRRSGHSRPPPPPAPARLRFLRAGLEALDEELAERAIAADGAGGRSRGGRPGRGGRGLERDDGDLHPRGLAPRARARRAGLRPPCGRSASRCAVTGGDLLAEPRDLSGTSGGGYRVFTPFSRAWSAIPVPEHVPAPDRIEGAGAPQRRPRASAVR